MNNKIMAQPELEIVQSILAEAQAKAERTRDSARSAIEAEDDKAGKERGEAAKSILAKAEETARKLLSREIATANVEAQRIFLNAREEAVAAVTSRIEERLEALRQDQEQYRIALVHLAAEAVRAIGESEVRLYLSSEDQAYADGAFGEALRSAGCESTVRVEAGRTGLGGGCIAASLDGRIVFNNTFPKRLERIKNRLRTSIVKEITKSDE